MIEDLREDQYLEDVFGLHSYLETEAWIERMVNDGKWIFDSSQIRKRMLALADITLRHDNFKPIGESPR